MTVSYKISMAAAASALTLGLATGAMAQTQSDDWWAGWDTDADGILSDTEFRTGLMLADATGQMDADGDGMVAREELALGYMSQQAFTAQDTDGDGMLTEPQVMVAIEATYDANGDGLYDPQEMNRVAQELGMLLTSSEG